MTSSIIYISSITSSIIIQYYIYMEPSKFQHETELYSLSAELNDGRLILSLTYKANSKLYTVSLQNHELPTVLTDSIPSLLDILFLFQNPKNFTVQ